MAMVAGSVSVDDDGDHTGTGAALAAYEAFALGNAFYDDWKSTDNAKTLKQLAALINAITAAVFDEITTNGNARMVANTIDTANADTLPDPDDVLLSLE